MAFESETAAAVDGCFAGVQSDEMGKLAWIISCLTFHFKFILSKFWMRNTK